MRNIIPDISTSYATDVSLLGILEFLIANQYTTERQQEKFAKINQRKLQKCIFLQVLQDTSASEFVDEFILIFS